VTDAESIVTVPPVKAEQQQTSDDAPRQLQDDMSRQTSADKDSAAPLIQRKFLVSFHYNLYLPSKW